MAKLSLLPLFKRIKDVFRITKKYNRNLKLRNLKRRRLRNIVIRTPQYTHCYNCGHRLLGMYCHACGQHARDINPRFFRFIGQYFENAFNLDGKFWKTTRLLFIRPGSLSTAFIEGKVKRYVFPLKLYMFVAVVFSFAAFWGNSTFSTSDNTVHKTYVRAVNDSLIDARLQNKLQLDSAQIQHVHHLLEDDKRQTKPKKLDNAFNTLTGRLPVIIMFAMPMFAVFSRLFFRRRYKSYLPHLVFSLHLHTTFFCIFALSIFVDSAADHTVISTLLLAMFLWLVRYGYIAAIRFFGDPWWKVVLKNIALYTVYYTFCFLVVIISFFLIACLDSWVDGEGLLTPLSEISNVRFDN